ncbi:unnamed protein product [Hymenolepis diminuta]|uniref:BRCT domain-containing protein n=1 Tax=Hymenolepis diminuta TaxID=6216 RepID=A0A0R3SXX3_HYMDI|nr:unnamed protein product [Hymenolepis diminuta]VUZ40710.1 unnamed protein product [Hymenolepis diminuta]
MYEMSLRGEWSSSGFLQKRKWFHATVPLMPCLVIFTYTANFQFLSRPLITSRDNVMSYDNLNRIEKSPPAEGLHLLIFGEVREIDKAKAMITSNPHEISPFE